MEVVDGDSVIKIKLKMGLSTALRWGTFVRLRLTQYDIAMSDCRVVRPRRTPRNGSGGWVWIPVHLLRKVFRRWSQPFAGMTTGDLGFDNVIP